MESFHSSYLTMGNSSLRIDKGSQRMVGCAYRTFDKYNVTFILIYIINGIMYRLFNELSRDIKQI